MFGFALNHTTVAKASFAELQITAEALQCVFDNYSAHTQAEAESLMRLAVNSQTGIA